MFQNMSNHAFQGFVESQIVLTSRRDATPPLGAQTLSKSTPDLDAKVAGLAGGEWGIRTPGRTFGPTTV